ncbi:F-box protein At4g18380-like [Corylus avellana]|uniref:F-box protein At4g18380-like n=1 Tax=Corylus avellana TaxID=13451 RepID=UPI001E22DD31|nr:F-box protein At4g18380-like [Corylus avellana]
MNSNSQEDDDQFDRLPDALLLLIFNKLLDAKTLIRCLSVSKRFASLLPQIHTIFLPLPCFVPNPKPREIGFPIKVFKVLVNKLITKPIQFLHHVVSSKPHAAALNSNINSNHFLYYSPNEVLKNFKEVKTLRLEIPRLGCEMGFNGGDHSLLKWKAEFGEELRSCIVLGATSFQRQECEEHEEIRPPLTGEELQSRIIWTISCLVSASMRHFLLKQIVGKLPMLQSVVITDASKQGKLCMVEQQLVELRNSVKNSSSEAEALESLLERTPIPNLCMKLWFVPEMELPASGFVMKGLTLVLIKPASERSISECDLLLGDLDGEDDEEKAVFGEAMREIVKRKMMFMIEMSSF